MSEYVFEGDVTPYGNTSSFNLPDGRSAGVGDVIELSDSEYDQFSKVFRFSSTTDSAPEVEEVPEVPEVQVESPEVTDPANFGGFSGTVGETV